MKRESIIRYIEFIVSLCLFAISFNLFLFKNNILVGSISALAIIVKNLFKIPPTFFISISITILFIINLTYTKKLSIYSLIGLILFLCLIFITSPIAIYTTVDSNVLLSNICGGILTGIGYGLIFKSQTIKIGLLKIENKNKILFFNLFIIIISTFIFGITNTMYSLIALYIMNVTIDKIVYTKSRFKLIYIISSNQKRIKKHLKNIKIFKINKDNEEILICLIPTKEYFNLKKELCLIDPGIKIISIDTYEVYRND